MSKESTKTKSKYRMPGKLWKLLKKHLPKEPKIRKQGRPRVSNRDVLDGIWHVLWTGCQWKSIEKEWFKVSSSVLHERFQTWQQQGLFEKLFKKMVKYYAKECKIGWRWQSVDSMMSAAPLGGSQTGALSVYVFKELFVIHLSKLEHRCLYTLIQHHKSVFLKHPHRRDIMICHLRIQRADFHLH